MLRFDFGSPPAESGPCPCCGGKTATLARWVYEDDVAYAVYFAELSENHRKEGVLATIGIGEWGEGSTPEQRQAFALRFMADGPRFKASVVSASISPWRGVGSIGRTLDEAEALAHPRIKDVLRVADQILADDQPMRNFLGGGSPSDSFARSLLK